MNSFFSPEAWRGYCIYNVSFPSCKLFPFKRRVHTVHLGLDLVSFSAAEQYLGIGIVIGIGNLYLGLDLVSFSAAEQGESTAAAAAAAAAECEGGGENCSGADMSIYMC